MFTECWLVLNANLPLLCVAGIVCLTPLALYLLWLAAVNRRDRPLVVAGVWDFVALLCSLSGFMVCLFFVVILISSQPLGSSAGGFSKMREIWQNLQLTTLLVPVSTLVLIVCVIAVGVQSRSRLLSVYNIDLPEAERAIEQTFTRLGLTATRQGYRWSDPRPMLEVRPFAVFSHVSVKILCPDLLQAQELERQLRLQFPLQTGGENPAGPWLGTAAVSVLISVICCVVLTFAAIFTGRA